MVHIINVRCVTRVSTSTFVNRVMPRPVVVVSVLWLIVGSISCSAMSLHPKASSKYRSVGSIFRRAEGCEAGDAGGSSSNFIIKINYNKYFHKLILQMLQSGEFLLIE